MPKFEPRKRLRIGVVTAVNSHEDYRACVPLFVEQWNVIGVNSHHNWLPCVVEIQDDQFVLRYDGKELVWKNPNQDMASSWISQVIRLFVPAYLDCDIVITTDVDMLPLNLRVFECAISALVEGEVDFVVSRDVLKKSQFPMCYNIASPKTWGFIFPDPLEQELYSAWSQVVEHFDGRRGKHGWYSDQELIYARLINAQSDQFKVLRLTDLETGHRRLEPSRRNLFLLPFVSIAILGGKYSDYHLHRPINQFRIVIRLVMRLSRLRFWFQRMTHTND